MQDSLLLCHLCRKIVNRINDQIQKDLNTEIHQHLRKFMQAKIAENT